TMPVNGKPTEMRGQRTVLSHDLQSARIYRIRWLAGRSELARGTTALGLSKAVFEEVRSSGRSACSLASVEQADSAIGALGLPRPEDAGVVERGGARSHASRESGGEADSGIGALGLPSPEYEGVLERVEAGPVPLPVVVDG